MADGGEAGGDASSWQPGSQADRDGTLDNTVVAHEWGHYLHHRLAECGGHQCGALSEGFGDFSALMLMLRPGDDLTGAYPMALYSSRAVADSYFGLRRQPYSIDMSKDGLTFKHIGDNVPLPNTPRAATNGPNSEVHNAGEVWATMMFEAYVALLQQGKMNGASFEDARRRMGNYVVAGLEMTPSEATYTEQRDAILAAAGAHSMDDMLVLAQAFARRGAGSCAVSPLSDSQDLSGVVESFEVKPRIALGALLLDDAVHSCDGDGILDAGERGHLSVAVQNGGPVPMENTMVSIKTTSPGIAFTNGQSVGLPVIAPYSTAQAGGAGIVAD